MDKRIIHTIPNVDGAEVEMLSYYTEEMSDDELEDLLLHYKTRRKNSDTSLILNILGFIAVAGVHRFYLGNILLGVIYLLTGGLCFIGTIVDLVNNKNLVLEANRKIIEEMF